MHIKVTQEHIDKGSKGQSDCCPIALALKDIGCKRPFVTYSRVSWIFHNSHTKYCVAPESIFNFVSDFDGGYQVSPTTFEINSLIPHPTHYISKSDT
jgi:hypothetical protein